MFSLFKRKSSAEALYADIVEQARDLKLYSDFGVPDTPIGRFQMIALHAAPYMTRYANDNDGRKSQALFDLIFNDIELSFREIGVGDLAVPKKMKKWMKDFNGIIQAHSEQGADHAEITRRNVFDEGASLSPSFKTYIDTLFS